MTYYDLKIMPIRNTANTTESYLEFDVVPLAEARREDEGRGGVVAEPVPARRIRLVPVDPDHDVAEPEDLHDGGHADGGKVQWIHRLQFHA